jgi:flagellar biosynthesis protein FlhF
MKIKRYTAADMRQALNLVRAEHGPDAVILASRRFEGMVEVTVADDEEVGGDRIPADSAMAGTRAAGREQGFEALLQQRRRVAEDDPLAGLPAEGTVINGELQTLRRMLETQLAALAWNDLTRRAPLATEMLRELTRLGFAQDVVAKVADALPASLDFTRARRLAIARLADSLEVTGDRWCDFGGVVALVGPAGVGKTTALARIAARWVMRHGPRDLALVSADARRFGAHDQVARIGRLLGAATFATDQLSELPALLAHQASRRLVLVDTAGMGPRDPAFDATLAELRRADPRLEIGLTVSATTQAGAIEELVWHCTRGGKAAGILTKIEECASIGGALSSFMRAKLPLAYLSEGVELGDGIRPARALDLVCMAVQLADRNGAAADEDMLSRRFGGRFNAAS